MLLLHLPRLRCSRSFVPVEWYCGPARSRDRRVLFRLGTCGSDRQESHDESKVGSHVEHVNIPIPIRAHSNFPEASFANGFAHRQLCFSCFIEPDIIVARGSRFSSTFKGSGYVKIDTFVRTRSLEPHRATYHYEREMIPNSRGGLDVAMRCEAGSLREAVAAAP